MRTFICFVAAIGLMLPSLSAAGNVTATVSIVDANESPVANAVVLFTPLFDVTTPRASPREPAIMNQINKQFVPHVLVVEKNTEVAFPNADNVFHHVYSFSPAKQFELKLYKEFTAEPLFFEQAGIVDIGCNIHDWMLGYIVITDTPFFIKTLEDGMDSVSLPKGRYKVEFWHPDAPGDMPFSQPEIEITENTQFTLALSRVISDDSGFDDGFGDY